MLNRGILVLGFLRWLLVGFSKILEIRVIPGHSGK